MKWSQNIFPKVFGAVFCFCTPCFSSDYIEAVSAAKRALLIQSGAQKKIQEAKRQYARQAVELVKEYNLTKEAAALGTVIQIARERSVLIQHNGTDYMIYLNEVRIRIHF